MRKLWERVLGIEGLRDELDFWRQKTDEVNRERQCLEVRLKEHAAVMERFTATMNAAGPMTQAQILEGLMGGADDPPVKSLLAIVRGLKEVAVKKLRDGEVTGPAVEQLRGRLIGFAELEEMVALCWGELQRKAKKG